MMVEKVISTLKYAKRRLSNQEIISSVGQPVPGYLRQEILIAMVAVISIVVLAAGVFVIKKYIEESQLPALFSKKKCGPLTGFSKLST
ncbi:MAG: hypothetical protein ACYC7D_03140 [Nitrososphaerales archaeon]